MFEVVIPTSRIETITYEQMKEKLELTTTPKFSLFQAVDFDDFFKTNLQGIITGVRYFRIDKKWYYHISYLAAGKVACTEDTISETNIRSKV